MRLKSISLFIELLFYFCSSVSTNQTCLSPYQLCSNTNVCSLSSKSCSLCAAGQYVCPISKACINSIEQYTTCPGISGTHLDQNLSLSQRLSFLITNLSLYEKYTQLTNDAPEIYRLGIPSYNWLNDDEHGVHNHHATQFPNGCGLGATWSKYDLNKVGSIIATEARALYNSYVEMGIRGHGQNGQTISLYSPNMNLVRDPRWGRAQEVYSEDPLLSGKLTYQFVTGIQNINENARVMTEIDGRKGNMIGFADYSYSYNINDLNSSYLLAAACCKHFAAYDIESIPETRVKFNAIIDSRNWAETYSPVFYQCVVKAQAAHVMCSYNSISGIPTCGNQQLLTEILRNQFNFTGFVVSDYDAMANIYSTHNYASSYEQAVSIAIKAGCDQEGGGTSAINQIPAAINDSLLNITDINTAFSRLYSVRFKLGVFDPPTFVHYNYLINNSDTVESEQTLTYARHLASKSMTLYKNEIILNNNTNVSSHHTSNSQTTAVPVLPLQADKINKIAVIGPQAISTVLLLGNYQLYPDKGVPPFLQALREILGENTTKPECQYLNNTYFNETAYFINVAYSPQECCALCYQDDWCNYWSFAEISYVFYCHFYHNITNSTQNKVSTHSSVYTSGICKNKGNILPNNTQSKVIFEYGCQTVACSTTNMFTQALNTIGSNINNLDYIIMFLGLDQTQEAEGHDRTTINLPGYQAQLVQNVSDLVDRNNVTNINTMKNRKYNYKETVDVPIVCILIHGGTLGLANVLDQCNVILDAWYPGQMGGYGIVDVLFNNGIYGNPAGRASVTYYKNDSDLPIESQRGNMDLYSGNGLTYRYFKNDVMFPFGFGLSYTTFKYSNLTIVNGNTLLNACDLINMSVLVTNTGNYDGDEVVQLYLTQPNATVPVPRVRLADFERVSINKGESEMVYLSVTPKFHSVVYNSSNQTWYKPNIYVEKGYINLYVGGGQPFHYKPFCLNASVFINNDSPLAKCKIQD